MKVAVAFLILIPIVLVVQVLLRYIGINFQTLAGVTLFYVTVFSLYFLVFYVKKNIYRLSN